MKIPTPIFMSTISHPQSPKEIFTKIWVQRVTLNQPSL